MGNFENLTPEHRAAIQAGDEATPDQIEQRKNAGRKGAQMTNEIKFHKKQRAEELNQELEINLQYTEILHSEGEEAADAWLKEMRSE